MSPKELHFHLTTFLGCCVCVLCLLLSLLPPSVEGFTVHGSSQPSLKTGTSTVTTPSSTWVLNEGKVSSIAHELQELDDHQKSIQHIDVKGEKQHHHRDSEGGFATYYHESRIHKLRRQIYEKDLLLKEALDELESSFDQTGTALQIAQVAEYNSQKFEHLYEEEHESIRLLLWQATKLATKRLKNGLKRLFLLAVVPGRTRFWNKNKKNNNKNNNKPVTTSPTKNKNQHQDHKEQSYDSFLSY